MEKINFYLVKKFVSTSGNENIAKKPFPVGETVFTAWNI